MKAIWKFEVTEDGRIDMPKGADILHVDFQGDEICLWAIVDTEAEKETRIFFVVGTGWETQFTREDYIGTVQMPPFVWHIFEKKAWKGMNDGRTGQYNAIPTCYGGNPVYMVSIHRRTSCYRVHVRNKIPREKE